MKAIPTALTLLVLVTSSASLPAFAGNYAIDKDHSAVQFKIRHLIGKVPGSFKKFEGTFSYDAKVPQQSKVSVEIEAASIFTDNEKRDKHLRSPDFFNAEKNPKITFVSDKVVPGGKDKLRISGKLTMNGVTRPVVLETLVNGTGMDPYGNQRAGFSATTTVNRKDYKILWNDTLDEGGLLLGDDVAISIEIEGILGK